MEGTDSRKNTVPETLKPHGGKKHSPRLKVQNERRLREGSIDLWAGETSEFPHCRSAEPPSGAPDSSKDS